MPLQPLSSTLTLDLILHVLNNTLFHPFVAALLPLCLRALAAPYNSTSFILTSTFAVFVSLYHIFSIIDERTAYGKPRKVRWEDEVVVITGGNGGLGRCLAEIFALKGVGVAVLDVVGREKEGDEREGVRYYRCDVGDGVEVERVWKRVVKDMGTPTVLVNNAAVVNAGPFLSQTSEEVERTFRVNTLSHYHLSRLFIRDLLERLEGGCIVTVSSVLAHLGASQLSAYTASKAALLAYHASLSAELGSIAPQIKTILVAPGQLDTQLFGDVKLRGWWRNFSGPVIGAGEVAVKIVRMLDKGESGVINEPIYARWIAWLKVLPAGVQSVVRGWSGIDSQFMVPSKQTVLAPKPEASNSSDGNSTDEE